MAGRIDLLIRQSAERSRSLQVFLAAPGRQEAFVVPYPDALAQLQQLWRTRFLRHHDPAFSWPEGAAVVSSYSEKLRVALEQWLQEPSWQPLQHLLRDASELPLTLRLDGVDAALDGLPWESLGVQRPIWRTVSPGTESSLPASRPSGVRARKPRILLVVGSEQGLNLDGEVDLLQQQQRLGRIRLTVLRGAGCTLAALKQSLAEPAGWDAVLYLGHSSDGPDGGQLHLGDGSQIEGQSLSNDWQTAARHGLRLLLLNSCSGLPLAQHAVASGLDWALCFLEPVPARAAALAFAQVLEGLENGDELSAVLSQTRTALASTIGCEGCSLLLSAVAATDAGPLRLPLRRRRQFMLRLATTNRRQCLAAAAFTLVAFGMELTPANPINSYLLDRRLEVQRTWRRWTHQPAPQPGPSEPPIAVLLLDPATTIPQLGGTQATDHTPRSVLTTVLKRTPAQQVPVVAFDVLFDQDRPGTAELAAAIRSQPTRRVVGGYAGQQTDSDLGPGSSSWLEGSSLKEAGMDPKDLAVGTAAGRSDLKPVPLHLQEGITAQNFAGALARHSSPSLPADRVIDWSLNWSNWIQLITPADLPRLKAPLLLVGTSGRLGDQPSDLFAAPATVQNALLRGEQPIWGGNIRELPGVLLQAVLIQTLNLRHWLTPLSQSLCTAAAAGLGLLLAALVETRRNRLVVVALIALVSCPLAWTLAIWQLWLVPLLLPLLALSATAFSRDD